MTNSNRIKLTWISFFSYALTGALVIVTGMVMGNIADYFHLPVSSMSNTFTFLNAGILISIFLNAWLMEIVPLKTQLRFGFILMVLAVAGLMLSHSLALFSASMFVLGLVSGITMSIGTFLITHMYEVRKWESFRPSWNIKILLCLMNRCVDWIKRRSKRFMK